MRKNKKARISTGVSGLDDILMGGLPENHLYLIEGDPGTGKTTVALQFLLAGIEKGEQGLYVTLSESKEELQDVIESHSWPFEKVPIFEMTPVDEELDPQAQYTVFHPSDVEMSDTIVSVLKQVDQMAPRRVVFDSLSELRMLARDPLRYRRQILGLKRYFAGRKCTVLLLDDHTADSNDLQLQSIAHGVVMMQNLEREFGVNRRRLEVRKLRGSRFREGFHDYTIETGGVVVYPRLIASEHQPGFARHHVSSGLPGLDALLGGGIDTGTSTLLIGPAGSGKSTIAAQYAVAASRRGEMSVIFAFDESIATLIERSRNLGMDLEPHLAAGTMELRQINPAEMSPGEFIEQVRKYVAENKTRVLVIDSINGFLNAMPNEQFLAMQLHEMLAYLGQQGVATVLTLAQHGMLGSQMQSPVDISYLADSVVMFRYFEARGEVKQAISVMKKRSGRHERAIRELRFGNQCIEIGEPLSEFEGVLTGTPRFVETKPLARPDGRSAE